MTANSGVDLEHALDELYGVDPADFMATRKRLVADLRAAGDAAAAKELGSARRPTNAAWALNQLARRHHDVVDRFLGQSEALREAQDRALSGRPDELREATRTHREALGAATQAANAVLGRGLTEAYRSQIAATLQAASVDDATADALRQGRVVREVTGATGFPDAGSFALDDASPSTRPKAPPSRLPRTGTATDGGGGKPKDGKARAARVRAEAELAAAEASLRSAEDAVAGAEQSAAAAQERVDCLRRELEGARDAARSASEAVTEARRTARDGAKAVDRLQRTLEKLSIKES